jgi:hypothetical protein
VLDIYAPSELGTIAGKLSTERFEKSTIYGSGNASQLGAITLSKWDPKLKDVKMK